MVTANSAPRLKDRSIMSDSYVERYMRAKKRHEVVSPKCLFGKPCRAETDAFLLRHEIEQMETAKEVLGKYDVSEISDRSGKDDLLPKFELDAVAETSAGGVDDGREEKQVESNVKFQPKIVTEHDRPPGNNLFVPIDKVEPSGAVAGVVVEEKLTDYWQTSKRRRSSNSKEDPPTSEPTEEKLPQQNNVKGDKNPQE